MPFNGTGLFSRVHNWVQDKGNSIKINASRMDEEFDGIATGLSAALLKDGQQTATANQPMGGFRHTGVGDAAARTDYAKVSQVQDGTYTYLGTSSGTDTITAGASPAITAYVAGAHFAFKAAGANTGAATLNIDGVGAIAIQNKGAALLAGDLAANDMVHGIIRDVSGTKTFQLISPTASKAVLTVGGTPVAAADTSADDLVISGSGAARGASVLVSTNQVAHLSLGDASHAQAADWYWDPSNNVSSLRTLVASTSLLFAPNNGTSSTTLRLNAGGGAVFSAANGLATGDAGAGGLHLWKASAGSASLYSEVQVGIENDNNTAFGILVPNDKTGRMVFGAVANNDYAEVRANYNSGTPYLHCGTFVTGGTFSIYAGNGEETLRAAGNGSSGGKVFIGAPASAAANGNMTVGLTLVRNTGTAQQLAFKDTNASHGMSGDLDVTTGGWLQVRDNANGGLTIGAYSGVSNALQVITGAPEDTTTALSTNAAVQVTANKKSGTGTSGIGTSAAIFGVPAAGSGTVFIVRGDGDVHNHGGSTAMSTYDDHDDHQLALVVRQMQGADVAKHVLADFVETNREVLVHNKIAFPDGQGGWFFSDRGIKALTLDYVRQTQDQLRAVVDALEEQTPGFRACAARTLDARRLPQLR